MSDRENQKQDYPEVVFTLVGDEGKSPEEINKEIERLLKLRDLYLLLLENPLPDSNPEPECKSDSKK